MCVYSIQRRGEIEPSQTPSLIIIIIEEKAAPGGYRAQTEIHSANLLIQSVPSCSDQKQRPYERKTLLCVLQIVVVHTASSVVLLANCMTAV